MAASFFASVTAQLFAGALLPYIEDDTGWSRSSITLCVTIAGTVAGFLSPFFGRMADKYGPRVLSSAGLVVTVIAMFTLGIVGSMHIVLFGFSYVFARAVSQNTLSGVVPRTTAVNWFRRMRGRALGMTQMAVPLGGAALIPLAQLMIEGGLSWQGVYIAFGVFMLIFLLPLCVLVLRRRPEDIGLLPDGDTEEMVAQARGGRGGAQAASEYNWTLKQALRTRALWFLIASMTVGICANGAIGFHQFAYFKDQGIAAGVAAVALSTYALSGAVANGLWGLVIERVPERLLGAATVSVAALLALFLLTVDTPVEAFIFAVLFGLAARGEGSIIVMIEAQYFGRESFGAISGFAAPFQQIALGVGPLIASLIYDETGQSYTAAFVLFSVMYLASAALIWFARKPAPPVEAEAV
jgi:sugar phosphate permease